MLVLVDVTVLVDVNVVVYMLMVMYLLMYTQIVVFSFVGGTFTGLFLSSVVDTVGFLLPLSCARMLTHPKLRTEVCTDR